MYVKQITPILNVSDLHASFVWFQKLGWRKCWDWGDPPDFGSVGSGEVEIFLCVNGQGSPGVWLTWWVASPADVDAAHESALANGLAVTVPPKDEPWGVRECHIRHPDGHTFRVSCGIKGGA